MSLGAPLAPRRENQNHSLVRSNPMFGSRRYHWERGRPVRLVFSQGAIGEACYGKGRNCKARFC
jgi:hypothetical protein